MSLAPLFRLVLAVGVGLSMSSRFCFAENYDPLRAGIVKVLSNRGTGTGFVINRDSEGAWIVTASHVIEGDPKPKVVFYQQQNSEVTATLIQQEGFDDPRGIAVLKVSDKIPGTLPVLPLAEHDLTQDEDVVVIGFPVGAGPWTQKQTSTAPYDGKDIVLTDNMAQGYSGGPVFDKERKIAGMMAQNIGLGKAVPISFIKFTLNKWQIAFNSNGVREEPKAVVTISPIQTACTYCPEMVAIPAGSFWMGSPDNDKNAEPDEKPRRKINIAAFSLGKYEVTRGQFAAFVADTGYAESVCFIWNGKAWEKQNDKNWRNPGYPQTDSDPVTCVSYNDALAYIAWLNNQVKPAKPYRLPTEAEWEYAARAGTDTLRYWGNDAAASCQFANVADKSAQQRFNWSNDQVFACNDNYVYTAPVGRFKANNFGLYDMLGNVWEWTCSAYTAQYDGNETQCTNTDNKRSVRGGSWFSIPEYLRSANRSWFTASAAYNFTGFRLARTD